MYFSLCECFQLQISKRQISSWTACSCLSPWQLKRDSHQISVLTIWALLTLCSTNQTSHSQRALTVWRSDTTGTPWHHRKKPLTVNVAQNTLGLLTVIYTIKCWLQHIRVYSENADFPLSLVLLSFSFSSEGQWDQTREIIFLNIENDMSLCKVNRMHHKVIQSLFQAIWCWFVSICNDTFLKKKSRSVTDFSEWLKVRLEIEIPPKSNKIGSFPFN